MSICRNCYAVIKFVTMESTRKNVPVEPIPDPTGTVAARKVKPAAYGMHPRLFGYVLSKDRLLEDGYELYLAHHAECARLAPVKNPTKKRTEPVQPELFDA